MIRFRSVIFTSLLIVMLITEQSQGQKIAESIQLPEPRGKGDLSLEETLSARRSHRSFSSGSLTIAQVSQLLWACQGRTSSSKWFNGRTAPSAGALYPLEIYLVVDRVAGLKTGLYHYQADQTVSDHSIAYIDSTITSAELSDAALGQGAITSAAVNLIITYELERTAKKYKSRALRYVLMEVGHSAQNVCLQVESLGLGVVTIGAFQDEKVKKLLKTTFEPSYILPVGYPSE